MEAAIFYGCGAIALAGALLMVSSRSPLHGVLWLVVSFLGIAGLFAGLGAHFLAAIQILVYAGAILVLFLFVIMLLNLRPDDVQRLRGPSLHEGALWFVVGVCGFAGLTGAVLWGTSGEGRKIASLPPLDAGAAELAVPLFRDHLLPFEATSLLLLAAIVGAVALTKRRLA